MSYSSVVRIFVTHQKSDYECPWQAMPPGRGTGSGVVIAPGQVLTGAHVVGHATFIQVQKVADPNKFVAKVKAICHDADLALLEIDDAKFMDKVETQEFGELPDLRDRVSVVGYPVGGEEISITEGVVSRVEVQRYSHSQRYLLAVTVDAAINAGNSGGPVFKEGKVIGIAFQALRNAKNIGELVPTPIIRKFLKGVESLPENEQDLWVPGISIRTQNLENPLLRKRAGLAEGESGVMVTAVEQGGSADGKLQVGDALVKIEDMPISNNGTVQYQGRYRTRFPVALGEKTLGDTLKLEIKRGGELKSVSLSLKRAVHLVPRNNHSTKPTFFVWGGLVFQVLSLDFLQTWDRWWENAPSEFIYKFYNGLRTNERQQLIVVTQILADEINVGYQSYFNESVVEVNGQVPRDMSHFVEIVEGSEDLVTLKMTFGANIVFDINETKAANSRILERYKLSRDRSDNLKSNKKGAVHDQA